MTILSLTERLNRQKKNLGGKGYHLLVKVSVNRYITRRIGTIRKDLEKDIRRLRKKTLRNLEEIFTISSHVARGKMKHQRINGKMAEITLRQRRRWLLVAGQTALMIKNTATKFDEQEISLQLNELEKQVQEATSIEKQGNPKNRNISKTKHQKTTQTRFTKIFKYTEKT